jgi:predicted anti-sigma-YlaC factor YlaD
MTCHDFNDALHEYLDGPPGAEAREHLQSCVDCRTTLENAQRVVRALPPALNQAAAEIEFTPELGGRILLRAHLATRPKPAPVRAWEWLAGHPVYAAAAAVAMATMLAAVLQARGSKSAAGRELISFTVDVPFHVDGQPGVSHLEVRQVSAD